MSTWKSGLQLSRGTSTGGHSKEMMRSKKNKPSRSALLPSDLWQLSAGQEPAEPLLCPVPNSVSQDNQPKFLLPVRDPQAARGELL